MPAVQRVRKQLLQRRAATLEGLERLELRSDIERHFARALVVNRGPTREQQCGQHIVRAGGAAHDEIADGLRPVAVTALSDGLEDREVALTERVKLGARSTVLLQRAREQRAAFGTRTLEPARIVMASREDRKSVVKGKSVDLGGRRI